MHINSKEVGNRWIEYTLTNDTGMTVQFINYGGIITKIMVPDKEEKLENVVLGYENYAEYEQNPNCFGAIIGRVAGRVQDASFTMDGKIHELTINESPNHLHGGTSAFHHVLWGATPFQEETQVGVVLTHSSPDENGGYPGTVKVSITYTLTNENEFIIDYEAISDQKTPLALTNHTYFNLTGNLKNAVQDHIVTIDSNYFLELDEASIPTGKQLNVVNTPFDFRHGRKLVEGFESTHPQNAIAGNGYDHYFMFNQPQMKSVSVEEHTSGRTLEIKTTQPGMVMYTANGLEDGLNLIGGKSQKHLGVCFETQGPPASLHHDDLPPIILEANEPYQYQTTFSFHTS